LAKWSDLKTDSRFLFQSPYFSGMKQQLGAVLEFHQRFGVPWRPAPTSDLPEEEWRMRHEIMREENDEYLTACESGDVVEIADALGDMLYVLCGTMLAHGMQDKIEAVVAEIHRSNMSKLGPDGKPIVREDGKILKGEGFFRPNLGKILNQNG
jgi:predicted HAD superfamily Cof-like phosphohydrolase